MTKKIIDIDSEFDDLKDGFFDEGSIKIRTNNMLRKGKAHPLYGKKGSECHSYGKQHTEESKKIMGHPGKLNGMYNNGHIVTGEKNGFFGKTHNDKTVEKLKSVALSREKNCHCIHCNEYFTAQAYKQHHGDYCEHNPNRIVKIRKQMAKEICPHCGKLAAPKCFARLHGDNCKHK
jgi:hypothetical protein